MTKLRSVIYARYSSDLQREASIEDQSEVCRRYIRTMGWELTQVYADAAISGATRHRPAFQSLIADARRRAFDVVVCEAVDRLGRRLADTADLQDTLSFLGIRLHTPSMGEITALHVGIMGMMAQLTLKDLAEKTKRGQLGRVRQGKMAGGLAYGYRVVEKGKDRGHRVINEDEALIVRRIFEEFASGRPPEKIARELNKEGIKGPFGREWSNTTLRGQALRGNGILNNETYIGKISWNRCSYVKDPSTGKRVARPNPKEKWEIADVPELRIVDDRLWNEVKRRQLDIRETFKGQAATGAKSVNFNATHRPTFLLSGLVKCGTCGGNFTVNGRDHLGCSNRHRKGTCLCELTVRRRDLEGRVVEGLKEKLVTPELIETFVQEFQREYAQLHADRTASQAQSSRKLGEIDRKLKAMTKAVEDGFYHPEMKERLAVLTTEKEQILSQIQPANVLDMVIIHPRLHELYRRKVAALQQMLEGPDAEAAREVIRSMIEKVVITRGEGGAPYQAVLHGELAAILSISQEAATTAGSKSKRPGTSMPGRQLSMVAGARFELTTFRL